MFFESIAHAMGQAPAAGGQPGGPLMTFMPLILMFVIFYFLLIRPQQKKQKEHKQMLDNLSRGDRVITAGGLYGRVVEARTTCLTLDLGNDMQVQVGRAFISALVSPTRARSRTRKVPFDTPYDRQACSRNRGQPCFVRVAGGLPPGARFCRRHT
jgi:preprotein translocase subunit YajC